MHAPSKRVTFLFAFLAANFLLWFPFATTIDDGEPVEGVVSESGAGEEVPGDEEEEEQPGEQEGRE